MSEHEAPKKIYLGDGVSVHIENGMLALTTSDGIGVTNTIFLEPEVWQNLIRFVEAIRELRNKKPTANEKPQMENG